MIRTFKFRLYPTKSQVTWLNSVFELCRKCYNDLLDERKQDILTWGYDRGYYESQKLLPQWKKRQSVFDLKLVQSQVLQDISKRVNFALRQFRVNQKLDKWKSKSKALTKLPRFKGQNRLHSVTYTQYGNGVQFDGSYLTLTKIGKIKVHAHRSIQGKPKTVTVIKSPTGKWYVSISCELPDTPKVPIVTKIGIDLGITKFVMKSDGSTIDHPGFINKNLDRIKKLNRKFKRNGYDDKTRLQLAHVYEKVANQRADYLHKVGNELVQEYDLICFEDLSVKSIQKLNWHDVNRKIADVVWTKLVQFVTYKAESAGKLVKLVNPRNTSQVCSQCGTYVPKTIDVRVHICPVCGLVLDRDHNAAINILRLGLQSVDNPRCPSL